RGNDVDARFEGLAQVGRNVGPCRVQVDDGCTVDDAEPRLAVTQEGGELHRDSFMEIPSWRWHEQDRTLRLLQPCAGWRRDAPLVDPSGRPGPVARASGAVGFVDLLHLGRVFDDLAERADEIVEGVVARAVAAGAPFDG